MRQHEDDIPQIKPSLLELRQIKLADLSGTEEPQKMLDIRKFKLKIPRPNLKSVIFKGSGFKRIILLLLLAILILFIYAAFLGISLYRKTLSVKESSQNLVNSFRSQDISVVKTELEAFEKSFSEFKTSYSRFYLVKFMPFVGNYYKDGYIAINAAEHALDAVDIVVKTVEPYADMIGFGGQSSEIKGDSTNDRIEFLIQTIADILPRADELSSKAKFVEEEISKIDINRYPEKVGDVEVRKTLRRYFDLVKEASEFIANIKPILEVSPYLLGLDETRTYLLLFQNDKELRPTGGFITAYSIINVSDGKIQPSSSNDIYNLDSKYRPRIEAPSVLRKYLKGPYLISNKYRLRDMNWSPDFKDSMELFLTEAERAGIGNIDGVIAVDTQVVVNILNAIGPVDVPGYGQYSTNHDERCACPQVIYELESFADVEGPIVWSENEPGKIVFAPKNYLNRKEIVGPLMNTILKNALGQPKDKLPQLFTAAWNSVTEKHVLFYMFDERAQSAIETFGIAGRVSEYHGDYLKIVDANLGGRKSNLYVTQEVNQEIQIDKEGFVTKVLNITYQNPKDYDGWLNSVLPNWTRIYLPKGTEVVEVDGFEDIGDTYEEFGKFVISGGFELRPKGIKRIRVKYKLPFRFQEEYKLLIQKQAGLDAPLYSISLGRDSHEFYLRTDKEFKFDL